MNLVDCYVTKVLSKPFKDDKTHCWGVEVEFDSYGVKSKVKLYLDTKGEALKIKIGYKFLN